MRKRSLCIVAALLLATVFAPAATTFQLNSADIFGSVGETVGWGFTLSNQDIGGRALTLTGLTFQLPNVPWYADNVLPDGTVITPFDLGQPLDLFNQSLLFTTVAAGNTLAVNFGCDAQTGVCDGLYGIIFDPSLDPSQPGFPTDRGTFLLSGQYDDGTQFTLRANYSATVGQPTPGVPEPDTLALLLVGVSTSSGLCFSRRFR